MCGIAAILQRDGRPCQSADIVSMCDVQSHRGPDDTGFYIDGKVGLGHRRLSIIDLSEAGHQPISNEDGSIWLVFNGEIYNYIELISILRMRGHTFHSTTDSEVILHLYEDEGLRCLQSLNGMFAFILWDSRTQTMFAARDRVGIKPLYYYLDDNLFVCSSEVKGILAHPEISTAVDYQGLADYLYAGRTLANKTLFANVKQLMPAHFIFLNGSGVRIERYWNVAYRYQEGRTNSQIVSEVRDLIDDAVRIHCRSDVPVGCHLSGGLDSSLVSSLVGRYRKGIDTFSVRFDESAYYDEIEYASAVARNFGYRHTIITPNARDLMPLLGPLTWHQDFPIADSGGFSYFCASRLAVTSVKVVLTGHGGDEVFGGYPMQFQAAFNTTDMFDLSKRPPSENLTKVQRLRRVMKRQGLFGVAQRLLHRTSNSESFEALWTKLHCDEDAASARNSLLHSGLIRKFGDYSSIHDYIQPLIEAPTDKIFDKCLYHDLISYLPHLLMKEDRASMAVSLESRVPLLDYRIIEYMATVLPDDKIAGRVPKALLREVASPLLPPNIVQRNDKTGFPVPLQEWISKQLTPQIRKLITSETSLDRGIFNPNALRDPNLSPREMLAILNLEVWFRVFIDRDSDWLPTESSTVRGSFAGLPPLPVH